MKVLFVVTYSPWPPVSGGAWRSYKAIEYLSESHDLTVALCHDLAPDDPFTGVEGLPVHRVVLGYSPRLESRDRVAAALGRNLLYLEYTPFELQNRWRRAFLETCESLRPDLVWFSELSTFWRCGPPPDIPTVMDMADIQSIKEARTIAAEIGVPPAALMLGTDGLSLPTRPDLLWSYYREGLLRPLFARFTDPDRLEHARGEATVLQVALAERAMLRSASAALLANPGDTPYVESLARCFIVPNGFDFNTAGRRPRSEPGSRLLFFGLLNYKPNIDGLRWFCERVWPQVLERMPEARFDVVGRHGQALPFAASTKNVTVHGFVEDLTELVNGASALVVPLLSGGGTRIKIIEAWARRLPIVSTPVGCEGLGARDGVHLLIAEDPSEFAGACVRLLTNASLGERLATAGFSHGRARFDWSEVLPKITDAVSAARAEFVGTQQARPE